MRDDPVPLVLVILLAFIVFLGTGKFAESVFQENCEKYYEDMPHKDVQKLCYNILRGIKE